MATKINNEDVKNTNQTYQRMAYSRQQMRDTIEGSNAVKRKREMYLPMPSGFALQDDSSAVSRATSDRTKLERNAFGVEFDLPWQHQNPAFKTYLQRAKFPDITARSLDALQGISTRKEPHIKLPPQLAYLEENATQDGLSLIQLYAYMVSEVLAMSKVTLVVDIDEDKNEFHFVVYVAESNIDWDYDFDAGGKKFLDYSTFVEMVDDECMYIEYSLNEDGNAVVNKYDNDCNLVVEPSDVEEEDESYRLIRKGGAMEVDNELRRLGKPADRLPIFNVGSKVNDAEADHIPLLGISDVAISIYQKDADLTHAEHLTCSPTLFMFGFTDENKPKIIGGGVGVANSNPEAHAEYTQTDTSGLDHVQSRIDQAYEEAASYGATIIGTNKTRNEKYETARLRNSSVTSTLVNVCANAGAAIEDGINYMLEWSGQSKQEDIFEPNTDFVEHSLDAAELTALVGAWINNAISQDTLLYNLFQAGKLPKGETVDSEKKKIGTDMEDELANALKDKVDLKPGEKIDDTSGGDDEAGDK